MNPPSSRAYFSVAACCGPLFALAFIPLLHGRLSDRGVAYTWLGVLASGAVLLVVARLRREDPRQWRLAVFLWALLLAGSMF